MKTRTIHLFALAATLLILTAYSRGEFSSAPEVAQSPAQRDASGPRTPVLVELFTSEGCSSCPPADALVARLVKEQPVAGVEVIVLKEHVDYWNRLGWKDRFSSAEFTARQGRYADFFGGDGVYTPQMVVDGTVEFVGSSERRALAAISAAAKSPKPEMRLEVLPASTGSSVSVRVHLPALANVGGSEAGELFLAVTEGGITSRIGGGENAGRTILHESVVRVLLSAPGKEKQSSATTRDVSLSIDPAWNRANLRIVAFVQERSSRRILAATSLPL